MSLKNRLAHVRAELAARDGAGRAFLVVWAPADPGGPDPRPPGVYRRAGVVEVVYAGDEPDPDLLARARGLAAPAALEIAFGPDVVPPPADAC